MQILVTGAHGKVGAATVHELIEAGHTVTGCDVVAPVYEGGDSGAHYVQADLTDAGDAFAVVRGQDVVIHCAALPEPTRNAAGDRVPQQPHGDLQRGRGVRAHGRRPARERLVGDRRRHGVRRAAVPRAVRADRRGPRRPPAGPVRAGEDLRRAADGRDGRALGRPGGVRSVRRGCSGRATTSGPSARGCATRSASRRACSFWSYVDVYDLAHALRLAAECQLHDWHEAVYVVSADNGAGRPLRELIAHHFGEDVEIRDLPREDAGGISYAKADRAPRLRATRGPGGTTSRRRESSSRPQTRLKGDTGVQRGRAALS